MVWKGYSGTPVLHTLSQTPYIGYTHNLHHTTQCPVVLSEYQNLFG